MPRTASKTKLKWPKTVKILGRTFTVEEASWQKGHELASSYSEGRINITTEQLWLLDILSPESKLETLIHEMAEGAMMFMGEKYDHDQFTRICAVVVNMLLENNLLVLPED